MDEDVWERARLIPVSGITGPDEQERRGSSALLAVIDSLRSSGGRWQLRSARLRA
jgi:hypothetical protein